MLDHRVHTFLTLCREMNYRKTAAALNMTQPGVTQHIQYLERHYGVRLFTYNGRLLDRTPEAEVLKRHFESIMAEEQAIHFELAQPKQQLLKVGATKTIGEFVLVPTVRRFLADPNHRLDLVVDNTETLLGMLERSELDFAVVEGVFDRAGFGHHLYRREEFVGICGKDHPFAGKTVSVSDIFAQTLILREQGSGTRKILEQAIYERGFALSRFERTVSASNFSVIAALVAKDNAITFAYRPVAAHNPDLAVFEVEDMVLPGEFNFVYCNEHLARQKIDLLFAETPL